MSITARVSGTSLAVVLLTLTSATTAGAAPAAGIEWVSTDTAGVQLQSASSQATVSADGRYAVFGFTNGVADVFISHTVRRTSTGHPAAS